MFLDNAIKSGQSLYQKVTLKKEFNQFEYSCFDMGRGWKQCRKKR